MWCRLGGFMSVFVILAMGVALLLGLVLWKLLYAKPLNGTPFEKKRFFFTAKQRGFYQVLQGAVGNKYAIFARVSMADVLRTHHELDKRKGTGYVKKLQSTQLSFVLCDINSLAIVAGVMLDEQVSQDAKTLASKQFVQQAFEAVGLPLLHFKAKGSYDIKAVEQALKKQLIEPKIQPVQDFLNDVGEQDDPIVELVLKPMDEGLEPIPSEAQVCPKCDAPMVLKKAEKGRRAGKYFLMCSTFPVCKRAIPVESHEADDNNPPAMVA